MAPAPIPVVEFANSVVRAGVEEHILLLLRGLDRRLFRPILACPPGLLEKFGADLPGDVQTAPIELFGPADFAAFLSLMRLLRHERVRILHSHQFRASFFASPAGRLAGVPLIIETTHVRELWRQTGWKSSHLWDRLGSRFVDRYIAVSAANARYLTEEKKISADKVITIRNGCEVDRFDPSHEAPPGLRRSLGFEEHDPVILVPARLEPQKGHRVLLEALPPVLERFPTTKVVFAGEGTLRPELESQAHRLGVAAAVRFLGFQSNIQDWLALCNFTSLPSFYEGLPIAAIESLAAGTPMVATAVDGTPEVVLDGKTGLLVPPGNSLLLADALCRLLASPSLQQSLGQAGRDYVLKEFSRERQIELTQHLYLEELARKGQVPAA